MSTPWPNTTDAGLAAQAPDVSAKISAAPTTYGLVAADATALASDTNAYLAALSLATDPSTRTIVTVEDKSTKKAVLIARLRSLGRRIQASPSVSNALKVGLGLNLRPAHNTPVPPPSTRPVLAVVSAIGRTVRTRMNDELTPTKRARPAGVAEAEVFSHTGETAPADLSVWTYEGQAKKSVFDITFPASLATGTKVWIVARWCNNRGEPGPVATPVSAVIVSAVAEAA